MKPLPSFVLSARWILPIEGAPVENGRLLVRGGVILGIEPQTSAPVDFALGNVAVLPGFVNAHTHLELGPIPNLEIDGYEDQESWLERVIQQRMQTDEAAMQVQVERGITASLAAGTTALADITTAGRSEPGLVASALRGIVFSEVIGLKQARGEQTSSLACDWLHSPEPGRSRIRRGLSPHAPYSTAGSVYENAVNQCKTLATHLAELPEELELLACGTGRLRDFLERINAWDPTWKPLSDHPADYLRKGELRQADWLVAHGNYLKPADFWQFRPQAAPADQRVTVVYCPRTSARFGHGPHPYRDMIKEGAVVCLGTDSLASAPSLSILDEIRFLSRLNPETEPSLLLTMGTLGGAWALRIDDEVGSLVPEKKADLAIVELLEDGIADSDPARLVVEGNGNVVATMIDGRFVFRAYRNS